MMIYSASSVADLLAFGDTATTSSGRPRMSASASFSWSSCRGSPIGVVRAARDPGAGGAPTSLCAVLFAVGREVGREAVARHRPINVQPSEIAKVAVGRGGGLSARPRLPPGARATACYSARLIGIPAAALVMLQPDMGTAMSMIVAVFFVLSIGRLRRRSFFGALARSPAVLPIVVLAALPPRGVSPLSSIPGPARTATATRSCRPCYAFGSGGLHGAGARPVAAEVLLPAGGSHRLHLRDHRGGARAASARSRSWSGLRGDRVRRAPDRRALAREIRHGFCAGGLTVAIVEQAASTWLPSRGSCPVTGIPLPFVSYGGSSWFSTWRLALSCRWTARGGPVRTCERLCPSEPRSASVRVLVSGGGTAGHVYPALTVADALRDGAVMRSSSSARPTGLEARLVPEAGVAFYGVPARGFDRAGR